MTGRLRKSVTIGACLVFIVMDRRADFYIYTIYFVFFSTLLLHAGMAGLFLKDPQELFIGGVLGQYPALPKDRKLHRFTQKS